MQSFQSKRGDQIMGIIVEPHEGDYLSLNNLKTLLRYIMDICQFSREEREICNQFTINDKGFYIKNYENKFLLDNIVSKLNTNITEKVIVPQDMGNGPTIRHRVFYFNTSSVDGQIEVKYTELGKFNSIECALEYISTFDKIDYVY